VNHRETKISRCCVNRFDFGGGNGHAAVLMLRKMIEQEFRIQFGEKGVGIVNYLSIFYL
jgi:hypothetical protein